MGIIFDKVSTWEGPTYNVVGGLQKRGTVGQPGKIGTCQASPQHPDICNKGGGPTLQVIQKGDGVRMDLVSSCESEDRARGGVKRAEFGGHALRWGAGSIPAIATLPLRQCLSRRRCAEVLFN